MKQRNYQVELDGRLSALSGPVPLLLHSCCAPCSSYVLEYLAGYFRVTVFFCNPNIFPEAEYKKRKAEQLRLIGAAAYPNRVDFLDCDYAPGEFGEAARGMEGEPEGGGRCLRCFALRLGKTAAAAVQNGFSIFGTTLTVSPHKSAELINRSGEAAAASEGIEWLPGDFKKRGGYGRSVELSSKYSIYRQDYCGCEFSKAARECAAAPEVGG